MRIDLFGRPSAQVQGRRICETVEAKFQIFLILLAVLAGTALLARRIDVAPAILLLLAGIALAFVPGMPSLELPPELVLLVVLPPLIYSASVAMSWREFKFNLRPIILLAVGCVIFTASAVAAATHYLIGLPWNVGFLLGAIVAPTDVVAPLAIARKLGIPRRILVVLEGEGLANDATALILYRFAVIAISTGMFSLSKAAGEFAAIVVGEIAVRRGGRLDQLAGASLGARPPGRDHAVADHALCRLLAARVFRRLRRDRNRRLRALCELERAAMDLRGHPAAGHLLLGSRDLRHRGPLFLLTGFQMRSLFEKSKAFPLDDILLATALVVAIVIVARFAWVYPATYLPRAEPALAAARSVTAVAMGVHPVVCRRARRGLARRGTGTAIRAAPMATPFPIAT